jgi:uncharacterized glyoxalase superfamily protein PhnB
MTGFAVRNARPNLGVRDVAASIEWYCRVLGARCDITMGDPVDFAMIDTDDDHVLALVLDPDVRPAPFACAYVNVTGVDAAHAHAVAQGAEVLGEPVTHPWGQRDFVVVDPDGHQLAVGEHVGHGAR